MYVAVPDPAQKFHDLIWDILRQSVEMQDMHFLIHDADRLGAEHPGLIHQPPGHDAVSGQQVIHGIGIKLVQSLIDLISILDLDNVLWRSQYRFAIQHYGDLLQSQRILLDGQGAMNCPDAIGAPQSRGWLKADS